MVHGTGLSTVQKRTRKVAELFGKTYGRAATVGTAINGFARAGMWPVDRDVFKDHHFSTSTVLQSSPVVEEVPVAKDTSTGTKTTAPRTTVATSSITEKISAVEATTSTQKTSTVGAAASTNTAAINPMCEKVPGAEATGNESAGGAATQIKVTEEKLSQTSRSLPSKETLRGHSDSSFRGEGYIQCCVGVRLCDMYSNQELAEIHFMYGKADGNAALARRLYQERYPQRQCPDRKTFVRLHYRLCEYGKFNSPGLGRGRPRSTTPEVQKEILEAVNMTPSISTRRVALQVNVPHTTVWRLLKE
ncbi:hypothetical protein ANN_09400 [Periplaneta americana]|uniref:DUF4817 domain-containing protein n=1 Tax=Periplaneta americana TaxID=6978 RepID=A0ABQ8TP62_PERAM|nr:hypothetical protein ANN_09400 [Periplaneta americana]